MTPFEQLICLYKQFLNLADEVRMLLEAEEYDEAMTKLQYKNSLLDNLAVLKKNIILNDEEAIKIKVVEDELVMKDKANLEYFSKEHAKVAEELKSNNKKIKVNSAYVVKKENPHGAMIDYSE